MFFYLCLSLFILGLQPQASVTSTGTVTVTGLYGIDCFREGEACWTCCTIDIDTENCVSILHIKEVMITL